MNPGPKPLKPSPSQPLRKISREAFARALFFEQTCRDLALSLRMLQAADPDNALQLDYRRAELETLANDVREHVLGQLVEKALDPETVHRLLKRAEPPTSANAADAAATRPNPG